MFVKFSTAGGKSFLVGGLFGRKQQQKPVVYDAEYASVSPISQNTEQNNVIRIASSSRADYTQGPIQSGEGIYISTSDRKRLSIKLY